MAVARSLRKVMMAVAVCSNVFAKPATAKLIVECYIYIYIYIDIDIGR